VTTGPRLAFPAFLATALVAAGAAVPLRGSTVRDVKVRGSLVVLSAPSPASPFMREVSPGEFVGLDYEIMTTFARSLEVTLQVRTLNSFDELIPALLRGDGDVIASWFTITEERSRRVDFSAPYFPVVTAVVTRQTSPVRTPADLTGRVAATISGSSHEERLHSLPGVAPHFVARADQVFEAVATGEADLALVDAGLALTTLSRYPSLRIAFSFDDVGWYGYAVTPGSDLRGALDRHLDRLRRGGVYLSIVRRIFGQRGVELFDIARPLAH
jgi:ABC-type amino acid transport substrate-binding protein